jgi:DNA-binding CsgD family transcriptional regulator
MAKVKVEEHGLPSLALVFGYIAVKELQRLEDRVVVLSRLGYGTAEIAAICDTTPATVRTLRSGAKKAKKPRPGKKGRKK